MSSDDFFYPQTRVPRNRFNERDPLKLDFFEQIHTAHVLLELERHPVEGQWDFAHLTETHRRIFDGIYPFAGEIRTLAAPENETAQPGNGMSFSAPEMIAEDVGEATDTLKSVPMTDLTDKQQARKAAFALQRLWQIYPFRRGNFRTIVSFFRQFCRVRGQPLMEFRHGQPPLLTRSLLAAASDQDVTALAQAIAAMRTTRQEFEACGEAGRDCLIEKIVAFPDTAGAVKVFQESTAQVFNEPFVVLEQFESCFQGGQDGAAFLDDIIKHPENAGGLRGSESSSRIPDRERQNALLQMTLFRLYGVQLLTLLTYREKQLRDLFPPASRPRMFTGPAPQRSDKPAQLPRRDRDRAEKPVVTPGRNGVVNLPQRQVLPKGTPLLFPAEQPHAGIRELAIEDMLMAESWIDHKVTFEEIAEHIWDNPYAAIAGIEADIFSGITAKELSEQILHAPEQYGELFNRKGWLPSVLGSKRGGGDLLQRAAAEARELIATYNKTFGALLQRSALRWIRMRYPVPQLSQEAKDLLMYLGEIRGREPDKFLSEAAQAGYLQIEVADDLRRFDEAVSRRFGVDSFRGIVADDPHHFMGEQSASGDFFKFSVHATETRLVLDAMDGMQRRTELAKRVFGEEQEELAMLLQNIAAEG
ncbi:MAG: Fic family protein [Methylobacteriaceae bacterium]|jgi:cell filamentation protein|nr:Fic family protein [Methylobacteriaceae bacterium]